MSVPTHGETFAQLMEHLRKAQEAAAMLGHLTRAQDDIQLGIKWLAVSENFRKMQDIVTKLATRRAN